MKLLLLLLLSPLLLSPSHDIKANQKGISIISERYNRISKKGGVETSPSNTHTYEHTHTHTGEQML